MVTVDLYIYSAWSYSSARFPILMFLSHSWRISNIWLANLIFGQSTQKNSLRDKTHGFTVFGSYVDLKSFVMSELLQA